MDSGPDPGMIKYLLSAISVQALKTKSNPAAGARASARDSSPPE